MPSATFDQQVLKKKVKEVDFLSVASAVGHPNLDSLQKTPPDLHWPPCSGEPEVSKTGLSRPLPVP